MNNKKINMMEKPILWLLIICACFAFWFFFVPLIAGIVLLACYILDLTRYLKAIGGITEYKEKTEAELSRQKEDVLLSSSVLEKLKAETTEEIFLKLKADIDTASAKLGKEVAKVEKLSHLYKAVKAYLEKFHSSELSSLEMKEIESLLTEINIENLLEPTAEIKLHSADVRDLRKQFRDINKDIDITLTTYEARYTTKANLAIYRLMVLALRAELQNVLYTMKYGKLEDAVANINTIADKYIQISADGNKSIAGTITRFVEEMRSLFTDAAKVEYEYYLRKERAKEEQKALREQMRQEAEERKQLLEQQKKIEKEESKYTSEMEKVRAQMLGANEEKSDRLSARIAELEALLAKVGENKEKIATLQNGKAGYIYIISNLGSFGDNVFKIGMTRRLEPQERIDELGSASVPFSFDVHSFIFSQDAPALETAIHHRLNDRRVNKVNLRKEFFSLSLDELEALVHELEPSAEFNRTMAAEQYRQSLSMTEIFTDFEAEETEDEE